MLHFYYLCTKTQLHPGAHVCRAHPHHVNYDDDDDGCGCDSRNDLSDGDGANCDDVFCQSLSCCLCECV